MQPGMPPGLTVQIKLAHYCPATFEIRRFFGERSERGGVELCVLDIRPLPTRRLSSRTSHAATAFAKLATTLPALDPLPPTALTHSGVSSALPSSAVGHLVHSSREASSFFVNPCPSAALVPFLSWVRNPWKRKISRPIARAATLSGMLDGQAKVKGNETPSVVTVIRFNQRRKFKLQPLPR